MVFFHYFDYRHIAFFHPGGVRLFFLRDDPDQLPALRMPVCSLSPAAARRVATACGDRPLLRGPLARVLPDVHTQAGRRVRSLCEERITYLRGLGGTIDRLGCLTSSGDN